MEERLGNEQLAIMRRMRDALDKDAEIAAATEATWAAESPVEEGEIKG